VYDYVAPAFREAFQQVAERASEGTQGALDLAMVGLKGATRLLTVHVVPLRDEPEGAGLLLITRDVARLRDTEAALRESRKMAAVGHLAGGFAHDFSNLLTGIMGGLWMVGAKLGPDHPATPMVAAAGQSGRRATDLVRRLMTIARRSKGEACLVALPSRLEELVRRMPLDPGITVVIRADPATWPVNAHPGELLEALLHLCENAREAMPQGGRLQIELGNIEKDGGAYARLTISDTGTGMDRETLPHIFEPFFTTKSEGQGLAQGVGHGLGLGLTVVQATITRLGGTIAVESEPGRGTRFVIEIPRHVEAEAAPEPAPPPPAMQKGHGRVVLVVDDEEMLRVVARAVLEQAGYAVLEAENAVSAMAMYQRERAHIGVVLTDMTMPGRSGLALLADLRACDPALRVILCSGGLNEEVPADWAKLGAHAYLPKPYSASELVEAVGQAFA